MGMTFGEAIENMKKGEKVARRGWNGKKQYIQLATGISYKTAQGEIVNCEHDAIGKMCIRDRSMAVRFLCMIIRFRQ